MNLTPREKDKLLISMAAMVARVLGADSASVRRTVVQALTVLRDARPLPRVWLC